MSGRVVRYRTARDFLKRNEPWLLEAEDRNNLVLSLAYGLAEGQGDERLAYLAGVEAEGRTVGCALRAPPHQVVLTEMPEAAAITVARHVAETDAAIPAVLGPPALAESFAREWVSLRGGAWLPGTDQRLYRLDAVTPEVQKRVLAQTQELCRRFPVYGGAPALHAGAAQSVAAAS